MYFLVNHTISNPAEFWARAQASLPNLPDGIRVHGVYAQADATRAACLWEAGSEAQIREYLEGKTGDVSDNDYLVVDATKSMGLPA